MNTVILREENEIIYQDNWRMTERQEKLVKEFGPCGMCGGTVIKVGSRMSECECGNRIDLPMLAIGLFEGRHEMPVDSYVFSSGETDEHGFHNRLYKEAWNRGVALVEEGAAFKFFCTGLTIAAIGFLDGCRSCGYRPDIMNFDAQTKEYVCVKLF